MGWTGVAILLVSLTVTHAQVSGPNVCTRSQAQTVYSQQRYTTSCKTFGWSRCTRYRSVAGTAYYTEYFCCGGYTASGSSCLPVCNGVGGNGGCNWPHGRCDRPNVCVCNIGYYGNRCDACPPLPYCTQVQCSRPADVTCHTCNGQGSRESASLFWPIQGGKVCRATCSHNNHWCWPGSCPDQLSSSCQCANGFEKIHTDNVQTKCELTARPTIQTCKVQGIGDITVSTKSASPSKCQQEEDMYLNFAPRTVKVTLHAHLDLSVDHSRKPSYIHDSSFGLSGGSVVLVRKQPSGGSSTQGTQALGGAGCDRTFSRDTPNPDLVGCTLQFNALPASLNDGDWMCVTMEAKASGFLRYQDFSRTVSGKQLYRETSATRELCLRYDSSAPTHCSASGACNPRPIGVTDHVIKTANVHVAIGGWSDPVPAGADQNRASGIEKMTLTLHKVTHASKTELLVSHDVITTLDMTGVSGDVVLPLEPALYALELEVKDRAHNVRQARTLILYDSSSKLEVRADRKFNVTSARMRETGFWQTAGFEFCFSWTGRYYNTFHAVTNFLLPLKADPRGLVSGPYDHQSPQLPATGTPNVDGVTSFTYSVKVNTVSVQGDTTLTDLQRQGTCVTKTTSDGDYLEMTLTSSDVMDHVMSETVGVHVDRSAPEVRLVSRVPGLDSALYVHDSTDLSKLQVRLEALDPHSGLVNLRWTLGHKESPGNIGSGTWPVHRLGDGVACPPSTPCYCPRVGQCEFYNYTLSMERLLHTGDHFRDYVFTVAVENVAGLTSEVRLDILVDTSPPETGTVVESGGQGGSSQDVDFTSSEAVHVRWSGFLDHESTVFKYRVGLGPQCLSAEQLSSADLTSPPNKDSLPFVQEVMDTAATFTLKAKGKFYSTVIAYNKALVTSRPVCSDGIVRDVTPPVFHNVTIRGAGAREGIACLGGSVYLLHRNATVVQLQPAACEAACQAARDIPWLSVLPLSSPPRRNHTDSGDLCRAFRELSGAEPAFYLPNDNVFLDWDLEEEESQIQETLVGFGSSFSGPDLEDFRTTFGHRRYHHNHEGLPTDSPLYVFLRATNKAGLAADVTLGPLVVDETPPHVRRPFSVTSKHGRAHLLLQPSDFVDEDEDLDALSLDVQVGYDGGVLPVDHENVCPSSAENGSRCYEVDLQSLRQQAGETAQNFFFLVHASNLAGHVVTARSSPLPVPSNMLPGRGRVFDLDPENPEPGVDIDYQMTSTKMCMGWDGFDSDDDNMIFVGVGTTTGQDNVQTASIVQKGVSQRCMSGLSLEPQRGYVATVVVENLAGFTRVSSDGVIVLEESSFPSLTVQDGLGCAGKEATSLVTFPAEKTGFTAIADNLLPGVTYMLVSDEGTVLGVTSSDIVWVLSPESSTSASRAFLALSRSASFVFDSANTSLGVKECSEDLEFTWQHSVSAHWKLSGRPGVLPTHFLVSLLENDCGDNASSSACLDTVVEFEDVGNVSHYVFPEVTLTPDSLYQVAVKPCFGHLCGNASLSGGVRFQPHPASTAAVVLSHETPDSSCSRVLVQWQPFHCGSQPAPHYHVTLTEVDQLSGQRTVFFSRGVTVTNERDRSLKSECRDRRTDTTWAVQGCVRGVCLSGQEATSCHWLTPASAPTSLYDLDAKKRSPQDAFRRQGNEGSDARAARLRAEDVDFVRSRVTLGAVLDQDWQGAVDWFVMAGTATPEDKCGDSPACVSWTSTSAKTVEFPEMTLQEGQRYRICARRSLTSGRHSNQTTAVTCSDGFLVDDIPPPLPVLRVLNTFDGFLRSLSTLHLQWSDVIDLDLDGQEAKASGIASVAFSVGSLEGGSNIFPPTRSAASSVLLQNLTFTNGLTYFASLKVTDQVGLTQTASKKFVVDTSPPSLGHVITGDLDGYVTGNVMELRWGGFRDVESGIRHFRVAITSGGRGRDVFPAKTFQESSATLSLRHVVDGHRYRVLVTAVNGAGLMSTLTSYVIYDNSPPTDGVVKAELKSLGARTQVKASWDGFQDLHSGVSLYRAGLGTGPAVADLEPLAHVALRQSKRRTWERIFQSGQEFYVIVEACNGAGLCMTSSSVPLLVDTSPPLPGRVHVGPPGVWSPFVHDSTLLSAQWFNFQDPHSGIARYQWCLGTSPTQCDVIPDVDHYRMTSLLHGNLSLPVNTDLYLRVRAFNKVGLSSEGVSDRFRVDTTPPEFTSQPVFLDPYSVDRSVVRRQWDDSVFVVDWQAKDDESPLVSQHVTVWAHGSVRIHESLSQFGVGRLGPYVIRPDNLTRLMPGDDVRINVTTCNAAGLCTQAASEPLLVDPTPPTVGGFRTGMNWTTTSTGSSVTLSWYGFEDAESGVSRYYVTVGRGYSDSDLSGGTVAVEEGVSATLSLKTSITAGDLLVLTIWADNGVARRSGVAKVTVEVVARDGGATHGFLLIQRHSCDPHYCTGDCTCAVVGGKCPPLSGSDACKEVPARDDVIVTLTPTRGSGTASASSSCLQGQWMAVPGAERYEWSAGLVSPPGGQPVYGDGVFLPATEPVWHDVGSLTSFVHCLPADRSLSHGRSYVAYLRVWYSSSSFHVFNSPPVTLDLSPPSLRRATSVSASLVNMTSTPDHRYESGELHVTWLRLFFDSHSNVTDYDVMVGSHPGGDDVIPAMNVGSRENYATNVTLHEGVPNHVTVVARNGVGLMTSHSARPLLLDDEAPLSGVVFTSADYRDAHAQSGISSVGTSWHGFLDRHSAIADYQVAVVDTQSGPPLSTDFRSVGMETNTVVEGLSLRHGHVYRVHVRAWDSAGHVSEAAFSSEIRVDGTPAHAINCSQYERVATVVFDGSFTGNSTVEADLEAEQPSTVEAGTGGAVVRLTGQDMYRLTFTGHAHLKDEGEGLTLQLDPALHPDPSGHTSTLHLSPITDEDLLLLPPSGETAWPKVVNVSRCPSSDVMASSDASNAVQLTMTSPMRAHVSVHVRDPESSVKQVMIGLGTTEGGFQIQPLKPLSGHVTLLPTGLPHGTPIYVTALVENGAGLSATFTSNATLDLTPPEVTMTQVKVSLVDADSGNITVSGDWTVLDGENDVTDCMFGLGSGMGSTSLIDWTPVSPPGGSLQTPPITGNHGDSLFLTLWCWNSLGLDTRVTSDPLPVYLHAPNSSAALVELVADNVYSVTPPPLVQGSGGLVRMRWEGFEGDDVIGYECRLSRDGNVLLDWTDVGLKNHMSLHIGEVQDNTVLTVTGEVRSYNQNRQTSIPIASSLPIDTRPPVPTGNSVFASLTSTGFLVLNWNRVFSLPSNQAARFSLALGRLQGSSDLLPPTSFSGTTYNFPVPSHARLRVFHVTLTATLPSGLSSVYSGVERVV